MRQFILQSWHFLRWHAASLAYSVRDALGRWLTFLGSWWHFASGKYLIQGLPVILMAGAAVVFAFLVYLDTTEQRVSRYRIQATRAFQAKDYAEARICYERLTQLKPDEPRFKFNLAQCDLAEERDQRALALITQLAPAGQQGFGPAHVWLAEQLVKRPTKARLRTAEIHLHRALQNEPNAVDVHALLGKVLLRTGRPKQALPHLLKGLQARPDVDLDLARIYRLQEKPKLARLHGERALDYFRQLSQASLDNHAARLLYAETHRFLGHHDEAVAILEAGLKLTGNPAYRQALGRAFVAWFDALSQETEASLSQRVALLNRALQYDFGNPLTLRRLLDLTRGKPEESAKVQAKLRAMLAKGDSTGMIHLVLGMNAQANGELAAARQHYESAYRIAPRTPVVMNNLAWVLAHSKTPDLPRALQLVDAALKQLPNQVRFRDTRGRILARMGRWKEALPDLQAALPILKNDPTLHEKLADAYDHLQIPAMAAEHRRQAQQLK